MHITLTAAQLRDALEFVNPDGPDNADQMQEEVVIEWRDDFESDDGPQPSGYYAYLADYPEEGSYGPLGALTRCNTQRVIAMQEIPLTI